MGTESILVMPAGLVLVQFLPGQPTHDICVALLLSSVCSSYGVKGRLLCSQDLPSAETKISSNNLWL